MILASGPVAKKYFGCEFCGYLCMPRVRKRVQAGQVGDNVCALLPILLFHPGLYTAPTLNDTSNIRFGGEGGYRAWKKIPSS